MYFVLCAALGPPLAWRTMLHKYCPCVHVCGASPRTSHIKSQSSDKMSPHFKEVTTGKLELGIQWHCQDDENMATITCVVLPSAFCC